MRFLIFISLLPSYSFGAVLYDTLYINSGYYTTFDAVNLPTLAYNNSSVFELKNKRIFLSPGDSLYLTIFNNDSLDHGFDITNTTGYVSFIPSGGNITVASKFDNLGVYIFYDNVNYPNYRYLGLGSMICVDGANPTSKFFWNIKEYQSNWNDSIVNGVAVPWNEYYPNYFTLNGASNPAINDDPDARVEGGVGDTIRIYVANTGQSVHSFHFHGYHCRIIYSSKFPAHVNRSKDTFPIYSMDSYILELIPDKVGEYPVHDHNLVAVTGGGLYPNGIFLTLLIE